MLTRLVAVVGFAVVLLAGVGGAWAADYDIDFKLTKAKAYQSLQFKVNYSGAPGEFSGNGSSVACTANSALNSLGAFNEISPHLKAAFIATTAFTGPIVVATCVFSSTGGAPTTSQFSITIDDWTPSGHSTPPVVAISRIALH